IKELIYKKYGNRYTINFISLSIVASIGANIFIYNKSELLCINEQGEVMWRRYIRNITDLTLATNYLMMNRKYLRVETEEKIYYLDGNGVFMEKFQFQIVDKLYKAYIETNIVGACFVDYIHDVPVKYSKQISKGCYEVKITCNKKPEVEMLIYDHLGQVKYIGDDKIISYKVKHFNDEVLQICSHHELEIDNIQINDINNESIIFCIGDSTVGNDQGLPRFGWGQILQSECNSIVCNLASSGRSLKSFSFEGRFNQLLNILESGDIVYIGFGHNDEKDTIFGSSTEEYKNLLLYYKQSIEVRGAKCIICTPIARRVFVDNELAETHRGYADTIINNFSKNEVLDLNNFFRNEIEKRGEIKSKELFLHVPEMMLADDTHLSLLGARTIAKYISKSRK
ncbi:MAG: SGNH/GDSL hydrolase family protein, partial [Bacilli bacterium]